MGHDDTTRVHRSGEHDPMTEVVLKEIRSLRGDVNKRCDTIDADVKCLREELSDGRVKFENHTQRIATLEAKTTAAPIQVDARQQPNWLTTIIVTSVVGVISSGMTVGLVKLLAANVGAN